jgi:type II secretory pathway predicted ATPase ExeA
VAAQVVNTQLDSSDLLQAISTAFGVPLPGTSKAQMLGTLEAFFTALAANRRRALLVIDEAQNLGPKEVEELRMLSNFQLGPQALLQSFLIGQPELRAMMQGPSMQQLRQRVIASYHLGPLDAAETQAYIAHRLHHVGWQEDPRFTPAAFAQIHALTGGIPRRINTLCNRLMLAGFLAEKHVLDVADVQGIADEMRDELGVDLRAATLAGKGARAPVAVGADGSRAVGLPEERMDRVERTLGAAVDLLHNLLHPEKAKPGAATNERMS